MSQKIESASTRDADKPAIPVSFRVSTASGSLATVGQLLWQHADQSSTPNSCGTGKGRVVRSDRHRGARPGVTCSTKRLRRCGARPPGVRTVQGITGPQLVAADGLEPAEHARLPSASAGQPALTKCGCRVSAAASSSTSGGIRGTALRGSGTSAANPDAAVVAGPTGRSCPARAVLAGRTGRCAPWRPAPWPGARVGGWSGPGRAGPGSGNSGRDRPAAASARRGQRDSGSSTCVTWQPERRDRRGRTNRRALRVLPSAGCAPTG